MFDCPADVCRRPDLEVGASSSFLDQGPPSHPSHKIRSGSIVSRKRESERKRVREVKFIQEILIYMLLIRSNYVLCLKRIFVLHQYQFWRYCGSGNLRTSWLGYLTRHWLRNFQGKGDEMFCLVRYIEIVFVLTQYASLQCKLWRKSYKKNLPVSGMVWLDWICLLLNCMCTKHSFFM